MEFKNPKGIFQQIADSICDGILTGKLKVGDKLPSVREQAANLGVNHNTIMRTYTDLQREEIILNKRGIGYFVSETALDKVIEIRRKEFFDSTLPEFQYQIELLKFNSKNVKTLIQKLKENEDK